MSPDIETLLAHDLDIQTGPITPPIVQTSLFAFESYAIMEQAFTGARERPIYSRGANPTVAAFEQKLAALEKAEAARGFASGMGAISAAILSQVKAGDRLVCVRHVYPDSYRFMAKLLPRLGIDAVFVDGRDLEALEAALDGARLLYLESPTSIIFECHDLARMIALAKAKGVTTLADNSWATPVFQRPLELGADLVVHSASKYLAGHSDVVAGVVAGSSAQIERIDDLTYPYLGARLSPLDAWLLLRGMRTLALRMPRHEASALAVARYLAGRREVTAIHHPAFSGDHQMTGTSGLFSFELALGVDIACFCDALAIFRLGVSWGGYESLVFPAMIGKRQTGGANSLHAFDVPDRLIRLSIGLEAPQDLIMDLAGAFAAGGRES